MQSVERAVASLEQSGQRWALRLRVACVCLPLVFLSALAWLDYRIEMARAHDQVAIKIDALAEHAQIVIQTIDLVLARVVDHVGDKDWRTLATSEETHDFLARLQRELPQLESVFLVDPDGMNVASSRVWPMAPYDVRTREYFSAPGARDSDAPMISAPFKGMIAGTYAFTVSRRIVRQGRFGGIVAVTVSPAYFEGFYNAIRRYPTQTAASLLRDDGAILVRSPAAGAQPPQFGRSDRLAAALRSPGESGLFEARSRVDDRERIVGYQKLRGVPLVVTYSLDRSVYLGVWRTHLAVLCICAFLLIAALLVIEHRVRGSVISEHRVLQRLVQETARRQQAESAVLQMQKLESLARLSAGIAHDFNNLLTAILGSVEMVLRRETSPRSERLLRIAVEAARRGARLTAQMLAFSRKQEVSIQSLDVNAVIRGMADLLHRTLGPLVRVRYELDALGPFVLADQGQLELALLNLAVNARDAMAGGGEIALSTRRVTTSADHAVHDLSPGDYVCIAVADTGEGMSEEVRTHALEPFYTTKGPGSGTGLGLSMVYGFVREIGGGLSLQSELGKGTVVSLFLRQAEAPVAVPEAGPAAAAAVEGGRVLVVDDDAGVRFSTAMMLEELGYEVVEGASGREALEILGGDREFDLLVLDFAMPGMNGSQLAAEITGFWPEAPVLFVTGYAENDALRPWLDRGMRSLKKPFSLDELALAARDVRKQLVRAEQEE